MSSLLTQGIRRQALTMMPCRHESALYISDWILSNTIKRFSIRAESECETLITGADSFTSDGRLIMNESAEEIDVGFVSHIYAMRLTHTGEDGFMLYIFYQKPWSGEPIYRNDEFCRRVTSAAYGFTLEKQICLGFVHASSSEKININYIREVTYEIDIATKRFKASPNLYQSTEIDPTFSLYTNQFSNSISQ
ncbi:unnamed protein product [Adineta steineri]|uniref:Aminomethyltransferase C-terminal domain-containing protein n=1 Tax=Adineta steineri TaxID=433720 RepID=A0A814NSD9_9BILA|nr:unnamed protein product [Adineta steineri]